MFTFRLSIGIARFSMRINKYYPHGNSIFVLQIQHQRVITWYNRENRWPT